jgi:hypothetical protein
MKRKIENKEKDLEKNVNKGIHIQERILEKKKEIPLERFDPPMLKFHHG